MPRFLTCLVAIVALASAARGASLCSLPHHPVAVGDVAEYRTTTRILDAAGDVFRTTSTVHKETVDSVSNDGYVTTTVKLGTSATSARICTREGIRPELPPNQRIALVTTGVSIPSRLHVGDEWTLTHEPASDAAAAKITTTHRAAGEEDVTVPAGTFRAIRVDHEITISTPGKDPAVTRGSKWFAIDAGLVRSVSTVVSTTGDARRTEVTVELLRRGRK